MVAVSHALAAADPTVLAVAAVTLVLFYLACVAWAAIVLYVIARLWPVLTIRPRKVKRRISGSGRR